MTSTMKKIFIILASIAVMTTCSGSKEDPNGGGGGQGGGGTTTPTITFGTGVNTNPVLGTEGGNVDISFTASDAWTAGVINTRADSWVSVSPSSGAKGNAKITITTTANDTPDERGATIQIKSGTTTKNIVLTQKQKDSFTASASKTELGKEGGTFTIEVKANVSFSFTIDKGSEWIKHVSTKALKTSTITFEASENEDIEKREGQITVTSSAGNETIKVYQDGASPAIILTSNTVNVAQTGGTVQVEVKSNVDVSVAIQDGITWVSEVSSKAMSTNTWNFSVEENDTNDSRTADIYFTNKANNLSEKVQIVQAQKDAIVIAQSSYNIDSDGGTIEVSVSHNVDFEATTNVDWITRQTGTKAMTTETVVFVVSENQSGSARSGVITFTSGNLIQKVTVNQAYVAPAEPEFPGVYGISGIKYSYNKDTDQLIRSVKSNTTNYFVITPSTNKFLLITTDSNIIDIILSEGPEVYQYYIGEEVHISITQNINKSVPAYVQNISTKISKISGDYMWLKDDIGKIAIIKFK